MVVVGDEVGRYRAVSGRARHGLLLPGLREAVAHQRKLLARELRVPFPEHCDVLLTRRSLATRHPAGGWCHLNARVCNCGHHVHSSVQQHVVERPPGI